MSRSKKIIIILSWAAVLLWMVLIFRLSSQVTDQSNELSQGITKVIMETLSKLFQDTRFDLDYMNHIIRKNAHFFAYFTLGILALNALRRSGVSRSKGILIALIMVILYAASDEFHQTFVPGRSGEVRDVMIDSTGGAVGIGLYIGLSKLKSTKIKDHKNLIL